MTPRPVLATLLFMTACATHFSAVSAPPSSALTIDRVELRYSNVFLLRSPSAVALVDTGSPADRERLHEALTNIKLHEADIKLVILTHGHGDHAGLAAHLQKSGAKIIVGRGDELQTTVGKNDEMTPTSPFAAVLKPFVKLDYEPFTPDVLVESELDLASYGLPGARARHMPGHTRGSLVVLLGAGGAIVGDQILGGVWGGMFHENTAGDHYYQLDPNRNRCNVQWLLDQRIETFHLGHGGPVTRDAVLSYRKSWPALHCDAAGPSER